MEDSKILGAKTGVQNMLFYYLTALINNGIKDPKQRIATEIGDMINLSEEQVAYVKGNIALENKILESISSSIGLLSNMEKTEQIDIESIHIVISLLDMIKTACSKAIKMQEGDKD